MRDLLRAALGGLLVVVLPACGGGGGGGDPYTYSSVSDIARWETYDAGAAGVGVAPDGFLGGVFDGRYVYFVPYLNAAGAHGEVLRFDTQGTFAQTASWDTYDAGTNGVGTDPDGYAGGVFDGRYVYFAPSENGTDRHGEVLRYDTQGVFTQAASWATYDPGANGVGVDPDGFLGAVFDGRYVYFVPDDNGTGKHGEVLRYDTQGSFGQVASWEAYDPGANGVGTDPDGYAGGVFDGRYITFVPYYNGTAPHGEVLRYDTQGPFVQAASWEAYDPGADGVGTDPDGYSGGVFDGRHVYFVPSLRIGGSHGEVMRYDTQAPFAQPASWETFDVAAGGVGTNPRGYSGGAFDGRYVVFAPYFGPSGYHGEVLRYDTRGVFRGSGGWESYDAGAAGLGSDPDGYWGSVFDGRYFYFAPYRNGVTEHGEVLRFDAKSPPQVPGTVTGGSFY